MEKKVAKKLNGKTVTGSGAPKGFGGDVVNEKYLVECKRTDKNSRSFKLEEWDKIRQQALNYNKEPLMVFEINGRYFLIKEVEIG